MTSGGNDTQQDRRQVLAGPLQFLPEVFVRGSGGLGLSRVIARSVAGRSTALCSYLRLDTTRYVAARVLPEMVFAVES